MTQSSGLFIDATTDIDAGVTGNILGSHDADQVEGWLIADNALNSNLTGMQALKHILTAPTFDPNWGTTPSSALVDALNVVISSNEGFGTFYAAPASWGHTFETPAVFANYSIDITNVNYPAESVDYGYSDFLSTLLTVGAKPLGQNTFFGFVWAPFASSAFGSTYVWTSQPPRKVGKLKTRCFDTLFPRSVSLFESVSFSNADVAMFSLETDINGRPAEAVATEWVTANTAKVAQWSRR